MTPEKRQWVEDAAKALAQARIAEAEAFLLHRNFKRNTTDNQARAAATIEMNGRVEQAQAEYEIALANLHAREG